MKIYHFDESGLLLGQGVADACPLEHGVFLIPAQATADAPPVIPSGKRARYSVGVWTLEAIPAPPVPPVPPSAAQIRAGEIRERMLAIDADSIRSLRAKSAGKGKPADDAKLNALDAEADALRVELAGLA